MCLNITGEDKLKELLGSTIPLLYTRKTVTMLMHKGLSLIEIAFYAGKSAEELKDIINGE